MHIKPNIALSDNGFIFNPATGDSYSVNPTGQEILRLMRAGEGDEDIANHLLEHFHTDRSAVEKDLYDFKNMLKSFKIAE